MNRFIYRANENITTKELAEKFNTTAYSIEKLNNIHSQVFKGMRLIIQEGEGEVYVVQPFDTLEKIAQKFSISTQKIIEYNNLQTVFIGQKIFIPKE